MNDSEQEGVHVYMLLQSCVMPLHTYTWRKTHTCTTEPRTQVDNHLLPAATTKLETLTDTKQQKCCAVKVLELAGKMMQSIREYISYLCKLSLYFSGEDLICIFLECNTQWQCIASCTKK